MAYTGYADLPLHDGHVPRWLAELMKKLARGIVEVIVLEYGPKELVERLSSPLWFQAFNNIIGMDWDSSGSTTVTIGILRQVLSNGDLGVMIAGGKGKRMLMVPNELPTIAEKLGIKGDIDELVRASRLSAKVDSALLQDGYQLYHHAIIVSEDGSWSVIQQGMNTDSMLARRYHWYSGKHQSFVVEPHSGIASSTQEHALNLIDRGVENTRKLLVDLAKEKPTKTARLIAEASRIIRGDQSILKWINLETRTGIGGLDEKLRAIYYRPIRITPKLLEKLRQAYERQPASMEELLLIKGIGAETIRALVLVADLIYKEPPSWRDPVTDPLDPFKYAFAFGGKDGIPFPVKREVMIEAIKFLREAVEEARIGRKEKMLALRRLKSLASRIGLDEGR